MNIIAVHWILKTKIKNRMYNSTMFEDLGFRYMGPIDGHDIPHLTDALRGAVEADYPIILHVYTVKGKGYEFAEKNPDVFHGISAFDPVSGEKRLSGESFSDEFGRFMCAAAEKDRRICCITAAMSIGTGLSAFGEKFPDRFFDVGIAEQHATTFAAGLARGGMLPVFAVYSTFLQRSYDQIIHDCSMQGLKIVFAVDRAGFVGSDGESHHGLFDTAFLNSIPDISVFAHRRQRGGAVSPRSGARPARGIQGFRRGLGSLGRRGRADGDRDLRALLRRGGGRQSPARRARDPGADRQAQPDQAHSQRGGARGAGLRADLLL